VKHARQIGRGTSARRPLRGVPPRNLNRRLGERIVADEIDFASAAQIELGQAWPALRYDESPIRRVDSPGMNKDREPMSQRHI
jgi:hypothetical protein